LSFPFKSSQALLHDCDPAIHFSIANGAEMSLANGIDAAQPTSALAPKAEVIDPSRFFREEQTWRLVKIH